MLPWAKCTWPFATGPQGYADPCRELMGYIVFKQTPRRVGKWTINLLASLKMFDGDLVAPERYTKRY